MPYFKLFHRLILRPLRREPLRTGLTVIAVALGIAAVLSIELAGSAAAGSFQSSMETLTGNTDFEVTATGGIPPEALANLARLPFALKLHARIEDYATIVENGHSVPLLGVDMLAESVPATGSGDADAFRRDDSVWVANSLGYKAGDRLRLLINDVVTEFTVRGVLGKGAGEVIVMDLAPATRVLRRNGTLDRILIEVPPDRSTEEWETILRRALPNGTAISREGARTEENRRMLAAFRWNLRVLSYIALAVGAFLIYNTISVSVVRRRFEIGILRALGATRTAILGAFLGEAAAFGLLGGAAGILLGRFMAEGAVKLVAATVDSLYVSSHPGPISLTPSLALLAIVVGIAVSVLSALSPGVGSVFGRARRSHGAG